MDGFNPGPANGGIQVAEFGLPNGTKRVAVVIHIPAGTFAFPLEETEINWLILELQRMQAGLNNGLN